MSEPTVRGVSLHAPLGESPLKTPDSEGWWMAENKGHQCQAHVRRSEDGFEALLIIGDRYQPVEWLQMNGWSGWWKALSGASPGIPAQHPSHREPLFKPQGEWDSSQVHTLASDGSTPSPATSLCHARAFRAEHPQQRLTLVGYSFSDPALEAAYRSLVVLDVGAFGPVRHERHLCKCCNELVFEAHHGH